jgi:hypothetical protein
MAVQIVPLSSALLHWMGPDVSQEELEQTVGIGGSFHFSTRELLSEFVYLLKDHPKVWAVAANAADCSLDVSTYVDSGNRRDREAVNDAERELTNRYPDVAFDFNTILAPAGSVILEPERFTFLHRLTLQEHFQRIEKGAPGAENPVQTAADIILRHMRNVPEDVMKAMPKDGASQHDHYLYGWPKREV